MPLGALQFNELPIFFSICQRRKKKLQKQKEAEEKRKAELAAQYKALGGAVLTPEQGLYNHTIESLSNIFDNAYINQK